jgi:HTTM domain/Vitamin K-dependent gamma-carboxylase, lumenal domain
VTRLREWSQRPIDARPLVVFRIAFGALLLFGAVRFVAKGWVASQYIRPQFHFQYYLFGWVHPLPGAWLYLVFAAQVLCAGLIAAGWHYRTAAVGFFLSFSYIELLDQTTYLNHYYFISLVAFLLILLPLNRWGSVDARRDPGLWRESAPRWISLVLQLQIAIVYFFAGVGKLNPDWLLKAEPLRIWLEARSGFPLVGPLFEQTWLAYAMSWGGAAFDLSIPFLLFVRRTRPWAYLAVVAFHLATGALFPIGIFPWVMIVGTLVFFDGRDLDRLRRGLRKVGIGGGAPGPAATSPPIPLSPALRWVLVPFFAVQLLMPLRNLAYRGPVLWTEEGFRFSWRVMVAEKTGTVFFSVTDPATGRSWEAFPGDYLSPQQERQMAFQPDMILEFAHHLRDRLESEGIADPEIRALAYVSLNGRPSQLLIDPGVDLARVPRSLARKDWVLPLAKL